MYEHDQKMLYISVSLQLVFVMTSPEVNKQKTK
jgi:hypothetical protein